MSKSRYILIILCSLIIPGNKATAQAWVTTVLSPEELRTELKKLDNRADDTTQIDGLLLLAEYYLWKDGSERSDLDSAEGFISAANKINSKQPSRKRDGLILLWESSLLRKRGDTIAGRQMVNKAIPVLKNANYKYRLMQAYLELASSYDSKIPEEAATMKNVFNAVFQNFAGEIGSDQSRISIMELRSFYLLKLRTDSRDIQLDFLEHIVRNSKIQKDKIEEFWARKEIADLHYQQGNLDFAMTELIEIANEQKAAGVPRLCFTYDLLSGFYSAARNYDKALYYALETIKCVRTEEDSAYLTNFYPRVAGIYSVTGSISQAIDWNLKRLNYLIEIKRTDNIYDIIFNLTSDLLKLDKGKEALQLVLEKSDLIPPTGNWEKRARLLSLVQCYAAVRNLAMAEKYAEELIKLNELRISRQEVPNDVIADQLLAKFYLSIGQLDKAEKYFTAARSERAKGGTSNANWGSDFLFKLDSSRGNYLSAIKHLQVYQHEHDSVFTEAKSKQIEELKISYETEQKEQNIRSLKTQDLLLNGKLRQDVLVKNISFAIAGLLVIIIGLFYNRYRLKQRANKKLALQQEEISKQNDYLQYLVNEKEWLLKEIHHRVKNNLQVVMSLLNSQSAYIDNEAALTAIHDSQHRVHAMSLIHQKLYGSENLSTIDVSVYIRELVSYLGDSFDSGQRIRFELSIEPLEMDVSQAVPLGLILNEAITNSIKYAFPNDRNGTISVSLKETSARHYLLLISDNGIGMPGNFDNKRPGSLGMSLMCGLSEDLNGDFSVENNKGTTIRISFVHNLNVERYDIFYTDVGVRAETASEDIR